MAFIIKTAPFVATAGASATLQERALYGGNQIGAGDDVFVWFSETQGGSGLTWRPKAHTVRVHAKPIGTAWHAASGELPSPTARHHAAPRRHHRLCTSPPFALAVTRSLVHSTYLPAMSAAISRAAIGPGCQRSSSHG
jgi:hypothetical protein